MSINSQHGHDFKFCLVNNRDENKLKQYASVLIGLVLGLLSLYHVVPLRSALFTIKRKHWFYYKDIK